LINADRGSDFLADVSLSISRLAAGQGGGMAATNDNFWLAVAAMGPVMFLAIGAFTVELARAMPDPAGPADTVHKVQALALATAFPGSLLPTVDAVVSLARGADFFPPTLDAVFMLAAIFAVAVAFGAALYDIAFRR
jgi:hypothetical protein